MPKAVDESVQRALAMQERKKKLKGLVAKAKYGWSNPKPGSIGERLGTDYTNRQTFKALIGSGMSPEDARKRFKRDAETQRMVRTEFDRQTRIKKKKEKRYNK